MEKMTVDVIRDKTNIDVVGSWSFVGGSDKVRVHWDEIVVRSVAIRYRHEMVHYSKWFVDWMQ
jgi:hypothetical protein